jgi:hypothetical protein
MKNEQRKKRSSKVRSRVRQNDGKDYEELVERVVVGLLKLEGQNFQNLSVKRDIKLDSATKDHNGQPIKRQIDVYWEFTVGGVTYRTIIQAKDWTRKVSLPAIDTFKNVLAEIPGQPKGILITKAGCQRGALEYAKAHGIAVYELKDAGAVFAEVPVAKLVGTFSLQLFQYHTYRVFTDEPNEEEMVTHWRDVLSLPPEEIGVFDDGGNSIGNLKDLGDTAVDKWLKSNKPIPGANSIGFMFKSPMLIGGPDDKRLKVVGLGLTLESRNLGNPVTLNVSFTHVLQLATGDAQFTIDSNFVVRHWGEPLSASIFQQEGEQKTVQELFDEAAPGK